MIARRTDATLALHGRGTITTSEARSNLRYLNDWATREVASAITDNYRERWVAERDASADAIRSLTT